MKKGRKTAFVLFLLILIFPLMPILDVGAASQATRDALREAQQRADSAGQRVADQQNLLDGLGFEMSVVMQQIMEMDQELTDVSEDLEAIRLSLLTTEYRIEVAEAELALAMAERDTQTEILRERVRHMHEQGTGIAGFLEVLFNATSIDDFFSRWEYIQMVAEFDRELLSRMEYAVARVDANVETLNRSHELILELEQQQIYVMAEIDRRMEEREEFFRALYEDAEREAEFLMLRQEEQRQIDLELGVVRAAYHREIAEAERIRREAEERRLAEERAARQAEQEARLAHLNSFDSFAWPLPGFTTISSGFGNRPNPFTRTGTEWHSGIDLPAPAGTRIVAAEAGYVRFAGYSVSWGNYIIIDHADGYSTLYAHNSRNLVTTGQRVTRGQHIGNVGTTGRSTGNHLHFEIRHNGVHRNPMSYFGG